MELGVVDPQRDGNYGSQLFIMCIKNIENHYSHPLAFRFDASGKGAQGEWGEWLMSSEVDACW